MVHFTDNIDPAFRYEELARFAFESNKWKDPWGYAAQDVYTSVSKADSKGKRILLTILNILVFKYKGTPIIKDLLDIENSIESIKTQQEACNIIDRTIQQLKTLDSDND